MTLRGLEGALHDVDHYEAAYFASYPLVLAFKGLGLGTLQNLVYLIAMIKIGDVDDLDDHRSRSNTNMGVAWHRFLAFPNIWFKREGDGADALGALQPMTSAAASRSTSRTRARTTSSASPRSSSSPGRACSTSPPAPSAAAASRSAPPGTPASRSPRSC